MEPSKKILLSLPASLPEALSRLAKESGISRNALIRNILKDYVQDAERRELTERMRSGYLKMSELNLRLAEDALTVDAEQITRYEQTLSEADGANGGTR